jgi:hypothetical protein
MARPLIALVLLLSACAISPTATPIPIVEPTAPPSPSTVPLATAEPGLTWSRVADAALHVAGAGMTDIVAGGPGFIAVGAGYANDASFAAAWTSVDGVTWERVPHTADFDGVGMFAVAAGGSGFVAVGGGCCPDRAAVWNSVDGRRWARVPSTPTFDNASIHRLVPWDQGLLAIGCAAFTECAGTLLMASADGLTWNRIPAAAFQDALISDVATGGPGLVAVGFRCPPGGGIAGDCDARPTVWVSGDGVSWRDVPLNDAASGYLGAIASGAAGLVAFGDEYEGLPQSVVTLRTSPDGLVWTRVPTPDVFANARVSAVRAVGGAFFALGHRGGDEPIPTIWRSVDGLDWMIVLEGSPADTGSLSDLVTNGTKLVAVGEGRLPIQEQVPGNNPSTGAMVWTMPATP